MARCSCYHQHGLKFLCYGTKEMEECSCGGDESRCNFYPERRKKGQQKQPVNNHLDLILRDTVLKMARHRVNVKGIENEGIIKGVNLALELFEDFINDVPKADGIEVSCAKWVNAAGCRTICNHCGEYPLYDYFGRLKLSRFCPTCGANMESGVQ